MRQYAPGDPQRFICGRHMLGSKLLVRTPERRSLKNLPCLSPVHELHGSTADVARYFLEQSSQQLAFGACGIGTATIRECFDLLNASGQFSQPPIEPLMNALKPVLELGVSVVVAASDDPQLTDRLKILHKTLGISPHVLLASSDTQNERRPRLERWGMLQSNNRFGNFDRLTTVVRHLETLSIDFEIINPNSGRRGQHEWS